MRPFDFCLCIVAICLHQASESSETECKDKKIEECKFVRQPNGGPCDFKVTVEKTKENTYKFYGVREQKSETYLAIGLSHDEKMGDDAVVACSLNPSGKVDVKTFKTNGQINAITSTWITANLPHVDETKTIGSTMSCSFTLPAKFDVDKNIKFNLESEKGLHLLVACGEIKTDGTLKFHSGREAFPWFKNDEIITEKPKKKTEDECKDKKIKECMSIAQPTGGSCDFRVTVEKTKLNTFQFHGVRKHKNQSYLAMGLSHDTSMGNDAVFVCSLKSTGEVEVKTYINIGKTSLIWNTTVLTHNVGETKTTGSTMSCSFTLPAELEVGNDINEFSLASENDIYLLVACGPVNSNGLIGYHNDGKGTFPWFRKDSGNSILLSADSCCIFFMIVMSLFMM